MVPDERVEQLMHSANNCTHMLHAIERKLDAALECLSTQEPEQCREILLSVKEALPEAITALDYGPR